MLKWSRCVEYCSSGSLPNRQVDEKDDDRNERFGNDVDDFNLYCSGQAVRFDFSLRLKRII